MKTTSKSPESTEVTPSKKKLKQATLSFAVSSDLSPKTETPSSRKRKLSPPESTPEPLTKIGKTIKEDTVEDSVVISDEDSRDASSHDNERKIVNPYVKLVHSARIKKMHKNKSKKTKTKSSKKQVNGVKEQQESDFENQEKQCEDVEMVVDNVDSSENEKLLESNIETLSDSQENQTPKCKRTKTNSDLDRQCEDVEMVVDNVDSSDNEKLQESNIETLSDSQENLTPKRKRTKTNSDLNTSSTKLVFDESINSSPSTPKQNKSLSENSADVSFGGSVKSANLTPKQLQKKLEWAKKQEERQKEKLEREKKRLQEKEERAKQKLEKEEQKKREREEKEEAKRKEREEKEEQRRKEKEEKEKQREMEKKVRELKEELKRKEKEDKEEQRKKEKEAREEERRKKLEALELEKQEQEVKKKKAAEAFVNFFVPKQKTGKEYNTEPMSKSSLLSSFTIKVDMRLAPRCRTDLSIERREVLDKSLQEQCEDKTYLKTLKDGSNKPLSSEKTWPLDDKDDDVMIIEDELPPIDGAGEVITCDSAPREKLRPKLLSFHENRRPPYWGTWRKKSLFVKPRRPFGQEKLFDYEVDSDDDWEDEGDGESLDGSAGGSEDEGADDYEVDNEVFVPHGYLSDEEATMDEDDVLSLSPETQKARLKHLEDEFESELKKPTEKLKPRLYGLLWANEDGGKPEKCVDALWNYFQKFAMIMDDPTPLLQPAPETEKDTEKKKSKKKKVLVEVNEQNPSSDKKKKKGENKEAKKPKQESKKTVPNQPGINSFLTKVKPT